MILRLLNQFETLAADETATQRPTSRREAFSGIGRAFGKAAVIGLPLAALFKPNSLAAQTGGGNDAISVLNFALTLEYLEASFYEQGLSANGLLTGDTRATIALIGAHEDQHVDFLRTAISGAGGTPVESPEFDFTAGGAFADVFSNEATFLAVAQALEDTGVRAYKGQAGNLLGTGDILTAALQIHSVEARHASMIRRMRGSKGWITGDTNTTAAAAAPVYAGEGNLTQLGLNAATVGGVSTEEATEAYDEPLSRQAVLDIAGLFIA